MCLVPSDYIPGLTVACHLGNHTHIPFPSLYNHYRVVVHRTITRQSFMILLITAAAERHLDFTLPTALACVGSILPRSLAVLVHVCHGDADLFGLWSPHYLQHNAS